jgi:methylenetetrahydrofolate--tRNA-(uracil-5-)-methyltransferase
MRGGGDSTPAHHTDGLAELVCSNSYKKQTSWTIPINVLQEVA